MTHAATAVRRRSLERGEIHACRLFGEMKHQRGSKQGSVLSDGVLKFETTRSYQADLVGLSRVEVGEPTMCGRLVAECVEWR